MAKGIDESARICITFGQCLHNFYSKKENEGIEEKLKISVTLANQFS